MAVVCFVRLFAIEAEGLEDGGILHREENGVFAGVIRVLMPGLRWNDKKVAGLPGESLAVV